MSFAASYAGSPVAEKAIVRALLAVNSAAPPGGDARDAAAAAAAAAAATLSPSSPPLVRSLSSDPWCLVQWASHSGIRWDRFFAGLDEAGGAALGSGGGATGDGGAGGGALSPAPLFVSCYPLRSALTDKANLASLLWEHRWRGGASAARERDSAETDPLSPFACASPAAGGRGGGGDATTNSGFAAPARAAASCCGMVFLETAIIRTPGGRTCTAAACCERLSAVVTAPSAAPLSPHVPPCTKCAPPAFVLKETSTNNGLGVSFFSLSSAPTTAAPVTAPSSSGACCDLRRLCSHPASAAVAAADAVAGRRDRLALSSVAAVAALEIDDDVKRGMSGARGVYVADHICCGAPPAPPSCGGEALRPWAVVQQHVPRPLLLGGAAFHLRVNVLCVGALDVLVHTHVVVHVATAPFEWGRWGDARAHVTNNGKQRSAPGYDASLHTISLDELSARLRRERGTDLEDADPLSTASIFGKLCEAVRCVFLTATGRCAACVGGEIGLAAAKASPSDDGVSGGAATGAPPATASSGRPPCPSGVVHARQPFTASKNAFEVFGFDFALSTENGQPALLEVNGGPALEGFARPDLCRSLVADIVDVAIKPWVHAASSLMIPPPPPWSSRVVVVGPPNANFVPVLRIRPFASASAPLEESGRDAPPASPSIVPAELRHVVTESFFRHAASVLARAAAAASASDD